MTPVTIPPLPPLSTPHRVRNFLTQEEADFASVCEYTPPPDVTAARSRFFHRHRRVLLYTERAHFYNRHMIRGIKVGGGEEGAMHSGDPCLLRLSDLLLSKLDPWTPRPDLAVGQIHGFGVPVLTVAPILYSTPGSTLDLHRIFPVSGRPLLLIV